MVGAHFRPLVPEQGPHYRVTHSIRASDFALLRDATAHEDGSFEAIGVRYRLAAVDRYAVAVVIAN